MRFLRITDSYPAYMEQFYQCRPQLAGKSFAEQRHAFYFDHFTWGDSLAEPLAKHGYEVLDIESGALPLLAAWAKENLQLPENQTAEEIVVEQAVRFRPDVLMFDSPNRQLLARLKAAIPSIRLVIGWTGSALGLVEIWQDMNIVLSCAPESVGALRQRGYRAELVSHAFDARVLQRLKPKQREISVSFIGSIIRRSAFHFQREKILLELAAHCPLTIFTPSTKAGPRDYFKAVAVAGLYGISSVLEAVALREVVARRSRACANLLRLASPPRLPVNRRLARIAKPAVYGLDYYQVMRESDVSLNIHADSSVEYASNIRLFEATGVGSCLLTDWRSNLHKFFEIDREVVAYRSSEECLEKARWLLNYPLKAQEIARRGQERTLATHTFQQRATEVDAIIRSHLL